MSIKKRIKSLLPSLREKKRYLAFEITSKDEIRDFLAVSRQIKQNSLYFLGELGLANAGMILIEDCLSREKQRGIIRVNNRYLNHVKASMAMIGSLEGHDVIVRSLGVSGSLKKAKEKYIAG